MSNEKLLDISWNTIIKFSIAGLIIFLLYFLRDILIWFLFALIISITFNPAIDFLQSKKLPRVLSTVIIYFGIFGVFSLLFYLIAPLFVSEIRQFGQVFPQYFEKVSPILQSLGFQTFDTFENFINSLGGNLEKISSNVFSIIAAIFGGIFSSIFILSIAIFISSEERMIEKVLKNLFPKKYESYALSLWERCQKKVSGWFLTRILGCFFVGIFSYVAFLVFGIKYPFSLALLAGVLNFIPIIGPFLTGAVIFFIASLDSFARAFFVLVSFILIQQIEGNIFTPILTRKFVGIPPVLVLVAVVIGGKIWGITGAILVIPLAGILFEFITDFLKKKKEEKPIVL